VLNIGEAMKIGTEWWLNVAVPYFCFQLSVFLHFFFCLLAISARAILWVDRKQKTG
jgi:hypothetical protein